MLEASARVRARHTGARASLRAPVCTLMRTASIWLTTMRACATVTQVYARIRHVTCEPIRARHTVVSFWLTPVRHARHNTHAPCATARLRATSRTSNPHVT
ncbi:hypothetical protein Hanom_Chr05g00475271 [Helianthus anomalus]